MRDVIELSILSVKVLNKLIYKLNIFCLFYSEIDDVGSDGDLRFWTISLLAAWKVFIQSIISSSLSAW